MITPLPWSTPGVLQNMPEKYFYLQRIGGLYALTLTDGVRNLEIGHETGENHEVMVRGADTALRSIQLYNRRNQTNYLVYTNI